MENRAVILVVTCFAFLAHFAVAEHGVTFLYPVDGLTLNYLDTINVTWTSNFSSPQLFTFCTNKTDSSLMFEQVDTVPPFNASKLVVLKYQEAKTCYFDLRPGSAPGNGANSPSFILLPVERSQTTIGLGSATSPTAASSSSSSATAAATTATLTIIATPAGGKTAGLSSGAKAGLGVGVASFIVLLAVLGAFLWQRRRKTHTSPVASNETHKSDEPLRNDSTHQRYELYQPPQEMKGNVKYELPTAAPHEMSSGRP